MRWLRAQTICLTLSSLLSFVSADMLHRYHCTYIGKEDTGLGGYYLEYQ
jgi:hypothetical protein